MKVYIKGKGVNLSNNNFVAQGGEGAVYASQNTAYKVYFDPKKMIPVGKIRELSSLTDPHIIRPQEILCDKKGIPIGYTMRFVKDGIPLCQLFPKSYRDRSGITHEMMADLIRRLKEIVEHCHQNQILIVDLNEMNFLSSPYYDDLFAIDADSYETKHYPATAIMDSIRDWKTENSFSNLTDWFSFAIISFQMFTGLHPFRGKYKGSIDGYRIKLPSDKPDDSFAVTRRRMKNEISVFHPEVNVPKAAYPFDVIPPPYRAWYEALFVDGKRFSPPDSFQASMAITTVRVITGTSNLDITEVAEFEGNIIAAQEHFGTTVVLTDQGAWIDGHRMGGASSGASLIGFSATKQNPVVMVPHAIPELYNLQSTGNKLIGFGLRADQAMSTGGRFYIRRANKVTEILLQDMGPHIVATTRLAASVMEHASHLYSGVAVQNMLGSVYVSLFPEAGKCYQVRLEELDEYRIVEAKYDKKVLMVIGEKGGQYDRFVFRFDGEHSGYDTRKIEGIPLVALNFAVLDSGVAVCMDEEERLEVFSSRKDSSQLKIIEDSMIGGDMLLWQIKGQLHASRGNKLYRVSMRT